MSYIDKKTYYLMKRQYSPKSVFKKIENNYNEVKTVTKKSSFKNNNEQIPEEKSIQKELLFFKDDILKDLRKIESNINCKINLQKDEQTSKYTEYENKINDLNKKISYINKLLTEKSKITNEQDEFKFFKYKTEDSIIAIIQRMDVIQKEIRDGLRNTEKRFSDTVLYPGLIGTKCKFSNFHFFIDYVLSHINQFLIFRDEVKNYNYKAYKNKVDKAISSFQIQLEHNLTSSIEFTEKSVKNSEKKLKDLMSSYDDKIIQFHIENFEKKNELVNKVEDASSNFGSIAKIRKEINDKYENYDKTLKELIEIVKKSEKIINDTKKEFTIIKKKVLLISEFLRQNNDSSRGNHSYSGLKKQLKKEKLLNKINVEEQKKISRPGSAEISGRQNSGIGINMKSEEEVFSYKKKFNKKKYGKNNTQGFIKKYINGKIGPDQMLKKQSLEKVEDIKKPPTKNFSTLSLDRPLKHKEFFNLTNLKKVKIKQKVIGNDNVNYYDEKCFDDMNYSDEKIKPIKNINLDSIISNNTIKYNTNDLSTNKIYSDKNYSENCSYSRKEISSFSKKLYFPGIQNFEEEKEIRTKEISNNINSNKKTINKMALTKSSSENHYNLKMNPKGINKVYKSSLSDENIFASEKEKFILTAKKQINKFKVNSKMNLFNSPIKQNLIHREESLDNRFIPKLESRKKNSTKSQKKLLIIQ